MEEKETKKSGLAIASLILGIIALLISVSIFKDLSLILAILGIVLGIVALCRKQSKPLSIIGIVLAALGFVILFSGEQTTTVSSGDVNKSAQPTQTVEQVTSYKLGDTITVKNNSGDEYTLTITNIKEVDDRNQFSEKDPAQVFLIDYTYNCISSNDDIYISDMSFKIIDEEGEIGESYPIDYKYPQRITSGITCKAQMALCVYNDSSKIKLQYFDNMFNSKPDAVFEIDL